MPSLRLEKSVVSAIIAMFIFIGLVVAGCGGGGTTGPSASANGSGTTTSQTAGGASLGSMDITVTRDSSGRAAMRNIPSNTASIKITVLSTGAVQTTQFPSDVNTITITVSNIPAGTQSVLIQAVDSGGNVLAQAQISINIIANGVATAQATLTPVVVPTPSPTATPLNYLYFGAVPTPNGTPGIVQVDLNKPLPTSVTPQTMQGSPQFMKVVTGTNGKPYLYVLATTGVSMWGLFVFDAVSLQPLTNQALPGLTNTSVFGMRADPVAGVLYMPVIGVNSFIETINVSGYTGSASFTFTEQQQTIIRAGFSQPLLAIDPTVTGNPSFFNVLADNFTAQQVDVDLYSIASPVTPSGPPIANEPNSQGSGDIDVAYVGTSPVGLFGYPTSLATINVGTFNPITPGPTPTPLPINVPAGSFNAVNVRFYQPAFLNGATAAMALVTASTFPGASPVGTLAVCSVTPGSRSVTSVVGSVSGLPAGAVPDIMAMEEFNGGTTVPQAFIGDAQSNGNVYVISLVPAASPSFASTIGVGNNNLIFGLTTYQQGLRSTH